MVQAFFLIVTVILILKLTNIKIVIFIFYMLTSNYLFDKIIANILNTLTGTIRHQDVLQRRDKAVNPK